MASTIKEKQTRKEKTWTQIAKDLDLGYSTLMNYRSFATFPIDSETGNASKDLVTLTGWISEMRGLSKGEIEDVDLGEVRVRRLKAEMLEKEAKAELASIEVKKETGELVEYSSVSRKYQQAATDFKNDLLQIPKKMRQDTLHLMKDKKKSHLMEEICEDLIRDAMEKIADNLIKQANEKD